MQDFQESKSIVLLDIENLLFSAIDDFGESGILKQDLASYIADLVYDIATTYAPPRVAYAAISALSLKGEGYVRSDSYNASRKRAAQITSRLIDVGFSMIIVPRKPDAADFALCDMGECALHDPYTTAIILATGDGREPFLTFVDRALNAKKQVCVVGYKGIPRHMRERSVKHVSLKSKLFARIAMVKEHETRTSIVLSAGGESRLKLIPLSEFPKNESMHAKCEELKSADVSAFLNLIDAARLLKEECVSSPGSKFSFDYLHQRLMQRMRKISPSITSEEIKRILSMLLHNTDVFKRSDSYIFNGESVFLRTAIHGEVPCAQDI